MACVEPVDDPFGARPVVEPELFAPGVVSTPYEDELGITFGPDGREAFFARGGGGRGAPPRRIFVSRFEGGVWTPAEVAPFSTSWDETPFLTADGSRLLFSSRRQVPRWGPMLGDANLWLVERTAEGWSQPIPLPGAVNKPRVDEGRGAPERSESGPVLLEDGTLLYWTSEDPDWGADVYVAVRRDDAFVDPRPLRLNSRGSESHPALSPDGRYLVFQAFRDVNAVGEQDLYVSERTEYGWGAPRLLPEPINSSANDGYPSFSPEGRYFFFASERGGVGSWSIYYVEAGALGLRGGA
jgi:hypothetical protein